MELGEEKENFVKLTTVIVDIVPRHLRQRFLEEWRKQQQKNPWKNDASSGQYVCNLIPSRIKKNKCIFNNALEKMIQSGNIELWDPTALFFIFLSSGLGLIKGCRQKNDRNPPLTDSERIDRLREIRNNYFAHVVKTSCSTNDFDKLIREIKEACTALFGPEAEQEIDVMVKSKVGTQLSSELQSELDQQLTLMPELGNVLQRQEMMETELSELKCTVEDLKFSIAAPVEGIDANITNIPPDIQNFVGRREILDEIYVAFKEKMFVVIHGMTGVGKSAVAVKFANEQKDQYHNRIWIDMRYVKRNGVIFEEISLQVLRNFDANIHYHLMDGDARSHLELTFRRLCIAKKQTLIILDNSEEFLDMAETTDNSLSSALKELVELSTRYDDQIHILATSTRIATEHFFTNRVKNISVNVFTANESKQYLQHFSSEIVESLHQSSCGFPLILELFSNTLSTIENEDDRKAFLKRCVQQPEKEATLSNEYVKTRLDSAISMLGNEELRLAITLSFTGKSLFFDYAAELCELVGAEISYLQRLVTKGIVKSTETGYSMHPFLQEIISNKAHLPEKHCHKTALIVVYIRAFLKLGEQSFEKNKLAVAVKAFVGRMSSFNHLLSILTSYSRDVDLPNKKEVKDMIQKHIFEGRDQCTFYLMLRFLYDLVPSISIRPIFEFLLEESNYETTKSMICACLDELDWKVSDCHIFNEESNKTEYVMLRRRQLSDKEKECSRRKFQEKECKTLVDDLTKLLVIVYKLENHPVKVYYSIKVNKLLGKVCKRDCKKAMKYFDCASTLSESNFGATFWTIDSYNYLAQSKEGNGDKNGALSDFQTMFQLAENTELINLPKIGTLLWPYARCCLKVNDQSRAKELMIRILNLCLQKGGDGFLTQAIAGLCDNFSDYPLAITELLCDIPNNDSVSLTENNYIKFVNGLFTSLPDTTPYFIKQNPNKERLLVRANCLIAAIKTAESMISRQRWNFKCFKHELFNWNKSIALDCSHMLLEKDRKIFAEKALELSETNNLSGGLIFQFLQRVVDAERTDAEQEEIQKVALMEKITDTLARKHRSKELKDQKQSLIQALNDCTLNWLRLKLLTCLLKIPGNEQTDQISWMTECTTILSDTELLMTLKPFYVLQRALLDLKKKSNSYSQLCQLRNTCIKILEDRISIPRGERETELIVQFKDLQDSSEI